MPGLPQFKKLSQNENVAAEINNLRDNVAARHDVTVDSLTKEIDSMIILALETLEFNAGFRLLELKAKVYGLLVKHVQKEHFARVHVISAEPVEIVSEKGPEKERGTPLCNAPISGEKWLEKIG